MLPFRIEMPNLVNAIQSNIIATVVFDNLIDLLKETQFDCYTVCSCGTVKGTMINIIISSNCLLPMSTIASLTVYRLFYVCNYVVNIMQLFCCNMLCLVVMFYHNPVCLGITAVSNRTSKLNLSNGL